MFSHFSVSLPAEITYGAPSALFPIRQCKPSKRTSLYDHLGMNSDQYTNEILSLGLVPLTKNLPRSGEDYKMIDDGYPAHTSRLAHSFRASQGITHMDWPPTSPDLNPIKNVWAQLKRRIHKREQQAGHPARGRKEGRS